MKNKLVSLTVAAALALTGISAHAAPATKAAVPLKIANTESDGSVVYKGKTVVSGVLEINRVNEAGFPLEFTVDKKSKSMIPKVPVQSYDTQFALDTDTPQIMKLNLNKKKCYRIPMTIEIDGYYSDGGEGGTDTTKLVKIIKQGTPALTSCNVG